MGSSLTMPHRSHAPAWVGRALLMAALVCWCGQGAQAASSLLDAMGQAYLSNPDLQAERAKLRSVDEQVPQALSAMRPMVGITTSIQDQQVTTKDGRVKSDHSFTSRTGSLDVTQPIYKGGTIQSNISGAQMRVLAGRASLLTQEQVVLLGAATAYMDVLRDQKNLEQYLQYQHILTTQLEIERRRLLIGESTKTDVSQAEVRLAQSLSARYQAEATLRSDASNYLRVVGSYPGPLESPVVFIDVPGNLEDILVLVRENNPDIIAAKHQERAARHDVEAVDGELLPTLNAVGSISRAEKPNSSTTRLDTASVMLRLQVPLDNGQVSSRARAARQVVSQMLLQVESAQRKSDDTAVRSWNFLVAARAQTRVVEAQIRSVNETLQSLRTEVNIGSRTVTDLLNAEQEALTARLSLIQVKRDEVVWAFNLLAAIGRLTAQTMKLPVDYYDYETHYQAVRGKIWGVSLASDPK